MLVSGRRSGTLPAFLVGFSVFATTLVAFFRVTLLPDIGAELSLSAADLGLVTTAFALGRLVADLPAGRMADRWPVTVNQGVAAAGVALASGVLAMAGDLVAVIGAAFVLGVASSVSNTVGMTYFSTMAAPEQRGRALARFSSALLVGQSLGPAVAGLLTALGSWRMVAAVGAAMAAAQILVIAAGAGQFRPGPPRAPEDAAAPAAQTARPLRTSQRVILYAVPFVMFCTMASLPQTVIPLLGASDLELSAAAVGLALGFGGVCRFLGNLVGGWASDRISRKAALVPGLALSAAGAALLAWEGQLWAWLAAIVVLGLASSPISTATAILTDLTGGRSVGRALGPFRFVGDLGMIIGPYPVTLILEHAGTRPAVLTVAALLAAAAAACALGIPETGSTGNTSSQAR